MRGRDAGSKSSSAVATRGNHRPVATKPIFNGVQKCGTSILQVFIGVNAVTKKFRIIADPLLDKTNPRDEPLESPRQRIRPKLKMHHLARGAFAAFHVKRRACADAG